MRRVAVCLLLLAGCSRGRSGAVLATVEARKSAATEWSIAASGEGYHLRIGVERLAFCDERGGRQVDLRSGKQEATDLVCAAKWKEEVSWPTDDQVQVSSPNMEQEANDRLCIAECYWLKGRAHGWSNEDRVVIVGTGSEVEVIDGASGRAAVVDHRASERMTIGAGWVAWVPEGRGEIRAMRMDTALAKATTRPGS